MEVAGLVLGAVPFLRADLDPVLDLALAEHRNLSLTFSFEQPPNSEGVDVMSDFEGRGSVAQFYSLPADSVAGLLASAVSLADAASGLPVKPQSIIINAQVPHVHDEMPCGPATQLNTDAAADDRPDLHETSLMPRSEDFVHILRALVEAHEDGLQATRQLLAICNTSKT
ncbi:hypothetical protein ST47_g4605 [Ascochyta rabiei]|uniref:Uncharacterized protein n=1 Tax=Didymella rabiei TaxID=5454 RepID=A0A163FBI9_DIDRA|nr:hypothetical protein ST47_g4605 [Ascochyta rabiei]